MVLVGMEGLGNLVDEEEEVLERLHDVRQVPLQPHPTLLDLSKSETKRFPVPFGTQRRARARAWCECACVRIIQGSSSAVDRAPFNRKFVDSSPATRLKQL